MHEYGDIFIFEGIFIFIFEGEEGIFGIFDKVEEDDYCILDEDEDDYDDGILAIKLRIDFLIAP